MIVHDVEQGSPEWLKLRTGLITASRFKDARARLKSGAPAQAQLDYMAELAIERVTGSLTTTFVNSAMQRGTELEPQARAAYEAETGCIVTQVGIVMHDSLPIGGSPDGLVDAVGGIEIKCPANSYKLAMLFTERDPSEYMDQIQGCMWLTDRAWWDLVPFHPALPVKPIRVQRDDAYIGRMISELREFAAAVDGFADLLRKKVQQ